MSEHNISVVEARKLFHGYPVNDGDCTSHLDGSAGCDFDYYPLLHKAPDGTWTLYRNSNMNGNCSANIPTDTPNIAQYNRLCYCSSAWLGPTAPPSVPPGEAGWPSPPPSPPPPSPPPPESPGMPPLPPWTLLYHGARCGGVSNAPGVECAPGLFCANECFSPTCEANQPGVGVCQPCSLCTADTVFKSGGTCASACGDLAGETAVRLQIVAVDLLGKGGQTCVLYVGGKAPNDELQARKIPMPLYCTHPTP